MKYLNYEELFNNNKKWIEEEVLKDPYFFEKLSKSQSPKYLMIGCSDSRVPLSLLMKAEPGEIFIHRNIANQVGLTDINLLSVLEYSVEHLMVEHIIITGHYCCGGVAAAVDGVDQGLIENWVAPIKDLYHKNKAELDNIHDKQKSADRLSEINVIEQAKNIFKTPTMERAFNKGKYPKVHAWIFNIYNGMIQELSIPIDEWKKEGIVPEFY